MGGLLAVSYALTASAAPAPTLAPEPGSGTAIIGGEPAGDLEFPTVVAVVVNGTALCTGTVVAANLVLTAGHCLADLPDTVPVAVFYGNEIDAMQPVGVTSFGAHPDFCATCDEDIYDYGYVVTASEFVAPYTPPIVTQQEWDDTMSVGTEITLVGFGDDPNAATDSIGVKRVVTTTIDRFSAEGLEFFAGGDDRDSCQGDSGGPAFVIDADGGLRLAGITSRGSSPCGDGGYYGAPYPALCWVREQTGIDFFDGGDCAAIDTSPPPTDSGGCDCRSGEGGDNPWTGLWAMGLVLLAAFRRVD